MLPCHKAAHGGYPFLGRAHVRAVTRDAYLHQINLASLVVATLGGGMQQFNLAFAGQL